ncbi:MAG: hypothetical protein EOM76_00870 [Sphingobacteriia bacterium]|nr:hypothetical protein [Sphingobacteriia bacterium]
MNNGGTSCWQEGHGSGSNNQLVADVNGNGKVDAVAYFSTGNWYIAYSNGSKFGDYSTWKTGHGNGSKTRFLGDVNGDGKADAVAFFDAGGDFAGAWYVSLSGSSANSCWRTGHGANSTSQMLGDVNGDGKADAVTYFHNITVSNVAYTGAWFVAISNGSGFNNYTMATSGHGNGSGKQFLGDVNGDGKADAIVYFSSGTWYVAYSSGTTFGNYFTWKSSFGGSSTTQMVADIDGDKRVEPCYYINGNWYIPELNSYTATYDAAGGSLVSSITYTTATNLTLAAMPSRTGYSFVGWKAHSTTPNTSWTENEIYDGGQIMGTGNYGDVTFTAQWILNVAQIDSTYYANLQSAINVATSTDVITLLANNTEDIIINNTVKIVTNNKTITGGLMVETNGILEIINGSTLFIDGNCNLISNENSSARVDGTVNVSGRLIWKKSIDLTTSTVAKRNQWLSLPFEVNIKDIIGPTVSDGTNEYTFQDVYGEAWRLAYYDSQARGLANRTAISTNEFFKTVDKTTGSLLPKTGYVMQLALNLNQNMTIEFPSKQINDNVINATDVSGKTLVETSGSAAHKNWWLIGQPYFTETKLKSDGPQFLCKMVGGIDHYEYYLWFENEALDVYGSAFVQYSGTATFVEKSSEAMQSVPRFAPLSIDDREYYLLILSQGEQNRRIGVILSDDGSNDYIPNRDLAPLGADATIQFYCLNGQKLIFNDIKKQSQDVVLGYSTIIAGEFSIALTQKKLIPDNARVTLEDKSNGKHVDLSTQNYIFHSESGTFDNRFVLHIDKLTTGVALLNNSNIVQIGNALIINNLLEKSPVVLYHVSGRLIGQQLPVNNGILFNNLSQGIYIIKIGDQVVKFAVK